MEQPIGILPPGSMSVERAVRWPADWYREGIWLLFKDAAGHEWCRGATGQLSDQTQAIPIGPLRRDADPPPWLWDDVWFSEDGFMHYAKPRKARHVKPDQAKPDQAKPSAS